MVANPVDSNKNSKVQIYHHKFLGCVNILIKDFNKNYVDLNGFSTIQCLNVVCVFSSPVGSLCHTPGVVRRPSYVVRRPSSVSTITTRNN